MSFRIHMLAAALASTALAASGAAMAQVGTAAGTTTNATAQSAPATINGRTTNDTAVTGMHTGTNAGAGPTGYTTTRSAVGVPSPQAAVNGGVNANSTASRERPAQSRTAAKARGSSGTPGSSGTTADRIMAHPAALKGRAVVGSNGTPIGRVSDVRKNVNGFTEVYMRTAPSLHMQAKVVRMPAQLFAESPGGTVKGNLRAPTVSPADLRQMPAASAAPAPRPM